MKNKTIKIVSRSSCLAQIQARLVANKIKQAYPDISLELNTIKSTGDIDKNIDISSGETPGLFTNNISNSIKKGENDIAIHSWKDVPLEPTKETEIYGTIERGDIRDLLFIKNKSLKNLNKKELSIFTSSPRRKYNSNEVFPKLLPFKNFVVKAKAIRGNIETRLRKYNESNIDGIIIAKTAFDRIINSNLKSDKIIADKIKNYISDSKWMILPLSIFPTAPGQGAIGIEANKNNNFIKEIIKTINKKEVFNAVEKEKNILFKYGGGCHQKIGVSVWRKNDFEFEALRGITTEGKDLLSFKIANKLLNNNFVNIPKSKAFPSAASKSKVFIREQIDQLSLIKKIRSSVIYLSRKNVVSNNPKFHRSNIIWTSGIKCWEYAAKKGYWINGSSESLGENEPMRIDSFINQNFKYYKLTHDQSKSSNMEIIPVYRLLPKNFKKHIKDKTHFFWMSSLIFEEAIKSSPEIINAYHSSGLGQTFDFLNKKIKDKNKIQGYLSYDDWKKNINQ